MLSVCFDHINKYDCLYKWAIHIKNGQQSKMFLNYNLCHELLKSFLRMVLSEIFISKFLLCVLLRILRYIRLLLLKAQLAKIRTFLKSMKNFILEKVLNESHKLTLIFLHLWKTQNNIHQKCFSFYIYSNKKYFTIW